MADVVEEFPLLTNNGRGKYPWHKWLDGRIWKLTKGVDFTVDAENFQANATANKKRRGIRVRTSVVGDCVYIQAILPTNGAVQ